MCFFAGVLENVQALIGSVFFSFFFKAEIQGGGVGVGVNHCQKEGTSSVRVNGVVRHVPILGSNPGSEC